MSPRDEILVADISPADHLERVVHGDGRRVFVGLHGWNGSQATFSALQQRLGDDARLISLDLPGYGQSPPPLRWSLEAIAAQIVATIDAEAGQKPVSLVGSCSGGIIALFVAPLLGERLDRFIFLEPFSFVPDYLRIFLKPALGRLFYYSAFGNPIGRWITNTALADHRQGDTDMMSSFAQGSLKVPLEYLRLFDAIPAAQDFADLPGKIELVHGERTFAAIRQSVDTWSTVWPHSVTTEVEDAGHLLLEEAPDEIARLIFTPT
jgi:pimeloyl-ACP methyl ester carboxylesterase